MDSLTENLSLEIVGKSTGQNQGNSGREMAGNSTFKKSSKSTYLNGAVGPGIRGNSLPCLYSNISIESEDLETCIGSNSLSTQHKKTAHILSESVQSLGARFGVDCLGFLTLTFCDHVTDPKEAQTRLNSLLSNVVKKRYREYVGVFERQKSGRIHYHFLVVLDKDIRTGVNFEELKNRCYRSAGADLRAEWAFWRSTARKYRFGRTELLPVRSTAEAMARYVGKYISKHIDVRKDDDKGVRLVRYSRGARVGTTRFMFHTEGAEAWRRKLQVFASIIENAQWDFNTMRPLKTPIDLHTMTPHEEPVDIKTMRPDRPPVKIEDISDFSRVLGKTWAYKWREFILDLPA